MNPLELLALALAAIPASLLTVNAFAYRRLPGSGPNPPPGSLTGISVLIPARNEAGAIADAVRSVLNAAGPDTELIVLDDHSTDDTARIVNDLATNEPRLRLLQGAELPAGWCGKQHACWQLASAARNPLLVFLDADVRLLPGALARISAYFDRNPDVALASGVPRQITGTWAERLLIPLIHFILLGFLPIPAARRWNWAAFAAGCGQLMVARRNAYQAVGGHRQIRSSLHDGIQLPRVFRANGRRTDLFDATDIAECRMYRNAAEVWRGLGKNATEGLADPVAIVPWTFLLVGGQVLPWVLLFGALAAGSQPGFATLLAAILTLLPRGIAASRYGQSVTGALLHPLGILSLVAIQWQALLRKLRGRPSEWRGRRYAATLEEPAQGATAP